MRLRFCPRNGSDRLLFSVVYRLLSPPSAGGDGAGVPSRQSDGVASTGAGGGPSAAVCGSEKWFVISGVLMLMTRRGAFPHPGIGQRGSGSCESAGKRFNRKKTRGGAVPVYFYGMAEFILARRGPLLVLWFYIEREIPNSRGKP